MDRADSYCDFHCHLPHMGLLLSTQSRALLGLYNFGWLNRCVHYGILRLCSAASGGLHHDRCLFVPEP